MHPSAFNWVANVLQGKRFQNVIEFGSRNVNGTIKSIVDYEGYYTGIDIKDGPDVDEVADAAAYRAGSPVDLVICMETLEHAPNWREIVKSASENLQPGGWFVMTCAGVGRVPHSAVDGGPLRGNEYYQNVDAQEFKSAAWEAGMKVPRLEVRPQLGDLYALAVKEK